MAQVSISAGDIQLGLEDEDESAKKLAILALKVIDQIVERLGKPVSTEGDDDEESDD